MVNKREHQSDYEFNGSEITIAETMKESLEISTNASATKKPEKCRFKETEEVLKKARKTERNLHDFEANEKARYLSERYTLISSDVARNRVEFKLCSNRSRTIKLLRFLLNTV